MTQLTKQAYEANPKAYWDAPRLEMEEIKKGLNGRPLDSSNPLWVKYILPELAPNAGHSLCLDLGCGGGRYIIATADFFDKVIGIDFSASNLEIARELARINGIEKIEFYHADLADIRGIPDASADFAYSVAVFMHMPNETKRRALRELCKVLKPDGCAVLIETVPIDSGAFDCPDIGQWPWQDMIRDAGLKIEGIDPAEPFTKYKLRRG